MVPTNAQENKLSLLTYLAGKGAAAAVENTGDILKTDGGASVMGSGGQSEWAVGITIDNLNCKKCIKCVKITIPIVKT